VSNSGTHKYRATPSEACKEVESRPRENEYPVWYFFYGTVADEEMLGGVLELAEGDEPHLRDASIRSGRLTRCGHYNALVDGEQGDEVHGKSYLVKDKEEEDKLMCYEGAVYDVIRCRILLMDGSEEVDGRVFRIAEGVKLG
jgi:gamma-glutamylcyclotransferase (GGCT)/AIG2-like uncharacterized protein YtfP